MQKGLKYTVLFLFVAFVCQSIFADRMQMNAMGKLNGLLNQFTTYQAQFEQVTTDLQNEVLQQSTGSVMMDRPNYFRWETLQPTHQIVITNGTVLWMYDVDLKQVTKQTIQKNTVNPAQLLLGNTQKALEKFTIRMIPHQDVLIFHLTPKRSTKQFRTISMAFKHDKLTEIQIENNLKQLTTFRFSHVKLNEKINPSVFRFTPPAGVDVLK